MADIESFGETPDGQPVERVSIAAGGLSARILTWGAVVQDLRLAGHAPPLVLGFERFDHYAGHSAYFGAIVGRFANRIAGGRITIDGERFETDGNDAHGNTLHGGSAGLDKRIWRLRDQGADFVTLALADRSGMMGFPGTLDIACTYRIVPPATLSIEIEARCDRPTLCNLAPHSYFNLDDGGRSDVLDHRLSVAAHAYLPVDEALLPIGEVLPVEGTAFDFVMPRTLRWRPGEQSRYDHNFCLAAARRDLSFAAWVQGASSGVAMEVWTTEPGLQLFSGHFPDRQVPGLDAITYRSFAGLCLEPQNWPDSPSRPYFPQAVLRPGENYRHVSEYRFTPPDEFQFQVE